MHVVCPHCFVTNRVGEDKLITEAKCGKCQNPIHSPKPVNLNDQSFFRYIQNNHLPVIVDYWADWCGPCKAMAPTFDKVASESEDILFAKVDTEQARQVSQQAGIRSIPTLIMFYQGKEINRISGGLSEAQLKQWIVQTIQSKVPVTH